MKAIILKEFGGPELLTQTEIPTPNIDDNEVLIKVRAIGLNPVDVKTRAGKGMAGRLKDFTPIIIGWDVSGTITAVGKKVSHFKIGDDVFGMVNFPGHGKAYAEFVAAPEYQLALKPANISHEQVAASTLAALTAYQGLVHHAKIEKGQRVLIHAASGGVGHFAVQIAKHLGAYVIGTSSAANKDFVLNLGADAHFDYHKQSLEEVGKVDFVLDSLGADSIERSVKIIKNGGALVSILGGPNEATANYAKANNISCNAFLVQSSGGDMKAVADLIEKNIIKPHVSKTFPFQQMAEAHTFVETGRVVGKVVVTR